jgi:hypothetical protein
MAEQLSPGAIPLRGGLRAIGSSASDGCDRDGAHFLTNGSTTGAFVA